MVYTLCYRRHVEQWTMCRIPRKSTRTSAFIIVYVITFPCEACRFNIIINRTRVIWTNHRRRSSTAEFPVAYNIFYFVRNQSSTLNIILPVHVI